MAGNVHACKGRLQIPSLPFAELDAIWDWNYYKADLQNHYVGSGHDLFVPTLTLVSEGSTTPAKAILFLPELPTLVPEGLDRVYVYEDAEGYSQMLCMPES